MKNKIEIYKSRDGSAAVEVRFEEETVWLSQMQMAELFLQTKQNISLHVNNCYKEGELNRAATVKEYLTVQKEGKREVKRKIEYYNLDVIISVGYRVKSLRGTQFRQWATQRLKDYLVQGYAINEKRLAQKQQEVEYLKTGIRILNRAFEQELEKSSSEMLAMFSKGLELLDDYDHEKLDSKGKTKRKVKYPEEDEYITVIRTMYAEVKSGIFARAKDNSFNSSVNQIKQAFGGKDLYPSIEEKAANLLYFITKNHSFIDGKKRIAAACFLYFLQENRALLNSRNEQIISNEALASLTLFIASSKPEESEMVKKLVISILNRNKD